MKKPSETMPKRKDIGDTIDKLQHSKSMTTESKRLFGKSKNEEKWREKRRRKANKMILGQRNAHVAAHQVVWKYKKQTRTK